MTLNIPQALNIFFVMCAVPFGLFWKARIGSRVLLLYAAMGIVFSIVIIGIIYAYSFIVVLPRSDLMEIVTMKDLGFGAGPLIVGYGVVAFALGGLLKVLLRHIRVNKRK